MDIRKSGLVSSGDSGSYSDLNRLNQLKVGDKNSDANMRKVAQEFESLFLNEMLKSMRSATEALGRTTRSTLRRPSSTRKCTTSSWRFPCPARAVVSAWPMC